jgi:hypothetical protein
LRLPNAFIRTISLLAVDSMKVSGDLSLDVDALLLLPLLVVVVVMALLLLLTDDGRDWACGDAVVSR